MNRSLVVLAAGVGSRYGGLKQIDPVGPHGEIVIDYSIYDAMAAGFNKLVFIIRKDIEEAFRETIGARFENRIAVEYVFQELNKVPKSFTIPEGRQKPWGTCHATLMAAGAVNEPFCVINADDFYGADAYRTAASFLATAKDDAKAHYGLVGFILRNTLSEYGHVARGICEVDTDSYLKSVEELTQISQENGSIFHTNEDGSRRPLTGDEYVSMNMWTFTPSFFGHAKEQFERFLRERGQELKSEFYIPTVVDALLKAGAADCRVLPTQSSWFGVTYREDKPAVVRSIQALVDQKIYPAPLWS